ncbi:leucine Rich Repeat family protein [Aphelenchoides avenae]|nr:leucine Rich Repeat family protein [Aphelenchus avenae]
MDLDNPNLAKTLECPVCLDIFDEPKLLSCGHTICQKCVNNVVATQRTAANAGQELDGNSIKCPECGTETVIPPGGLKTNYCLVDLVCRAQKPMVDACACSGCGKQAPAADMFTCHTCQETLNCKPIWLCALCAMKQHRGHAMAECNRATKQQIQDACRGISSSGSLADMYIGLTMSRLSGALEKTELIAQLLKLQKRGFSRLEARVKGADNDLTQEDLAESLQAASELKRKFEQASTIANEVGKNLDSALHDCLDKLEDLFPKDEDEEPKDRGTSRNNFDLDEFDDDQDVIELRECRIDVIPDISRFTMLQDLGFRNNLLKSINDNIVNATLTKLDLRSNMITEIRGLDALVNLEVLDLSNNRLKKIEGLDNMAKLERLHLEHNIIAKIEGLDTLVYLELLDLDDNCIKAIENLGNQRNLRGLYLGRNKIRNIENVSHLTKLRVLGISGNRITKLEYLEALTDLEELYVAKQWIETFEGIQNLNKLARINAANNSIARLDLLDHLQQLEELYLCGNMISQWSDVDKLAKLAMLGTVYLRGNPIEAQDRDDYRRKVVLALPQVTEVDDAPCR